MACLKAKPLGKIGLVALIIFALVCAASSFEYAARLNHSEARNLSLLNILQSERAAIIHALRVKITERQAELEFMVWPREHRKIQAELQATLQQILNLAPYQAADWQTLLATTRAEDASRKEQFWLLERAIISNKWQRRRRPGLAHYCINQLAELNAQLKSECLQLVAALPWQDNRTHLAKITGVDPLQLDRALHQAGVL